MDGHDLLVGTQARSDTVHQDGEHGDHEVECEDARGRQGLPAPPRPLEGALTPLWGFGYFEFLVFLWFG